MVDTVHGAGAAIRRALLARREEMADLIGDLVRIPTENPPGRHYRPLVDLLAGRMAALDLTPEIIPIPVDHGDEPRYALTAAHGAGTRTIVFHGHYDVVPSADPVQFEPFRQGDTLFGRGTADMKGGLVAMLYAVRALADSGASLDGRVSLMVVPDEETGGALGSQYLASRGHLASDAIGMLTAEPTSGVVWNASRGAISLDVTVKGRPAHVGLQHLGVNAFERMMAVAAMLTGLRDEIAARRTAYAVEPDAARGSILLVGGRSEGGTNFNVVPAECRFTVDRRLNPEEDFDAEKRRLLDVFEAARARGIDLHVEILQEGEASGCPSDTPLATALLAAIETVTGSAPPTEMCPGLLETRFYAARGVPAYAYGPGLLTVAHGPKEFVKLDAVVDCATIYALTASSVLGTA
jgi:acetylornithine deacetylase/succinyl-diaminopimelate desuccinylase family protein